MIYLSNDVRNHENCPRAFDKTGVLCVVLDVGDLVLVLNKSDFLLAKNRQSFVLIGHLQYLFVYSLYCGNVIESFIASHLNQVYQKLYSPQKCLYFVQSSYFCSDRLYGLPRPDF